MKLASGMPIALGVGIQARGIKSHARVLLWISLNIPAVCWDSLLPQNASDYCRSFSELATSQSLQDLYEWLRTQMLTLCKLPTCTDSFPNSVCSNEDTQNCQQFTSVSCTGLVHFTLDLQPLEHLVIANYTSWLHTRRDLD